MANFILVHRSGSNEPLLLNLEHVIHARRSTPDDSTIVKLTNDEHIGIVERLDFLLDD
jgi:hypothetical protein